VLATTTSAFGNLHTLRLFLTLATRDPAMIPESLREQVQPIIRQALDIVSDPASIGPETRPESIALAYAMRTNPELETDIHHLVELQRINQGIAGTALQHLDAAFAA